MSLIDAARLVWLQQRLPW